MPSVRAPIDLPDRIALFPLNGTILLPSGRVSLHVFEPRYVQMIDDILGQSRTVGIIQPRTFVADPIPNDTALCDVGTAGRIVQFSDSGDGRYHISLEGLSRFRLKPIEAHRSKIEERSGYLCADVDFTPYQSDMLPPAKHG